MTEKQKTSILNLKDWSTFLIIFAAISIIAQVFNFHHILGIGTAKTANVWLMFKGYVVLYTGTIVGLICAKYIRIGWPAVIWVSLVLIVVSLPWLPTHKFVTEITKPVALLPMASAIIAYAGIAIARNELKLFKEAGWKIIILACLTFAGSFFFSALISEFVLKAMGQI
ncbi:MAG: hypothetical protein MJE63_14415 [Proteobacteria bacterium]|nr:hypothetical protein [Pseudomonadota bacterium]